jgi:hypothetical protein
MTMKYPVVMSIGVQRYAAVTKLSVFLTALEMHLCACFSSFPNAKRIPFLSEHKSNNYVLCYGQQVH